MGRVQSVFCQNQLALQRLGLSSVPPPCLFEVQAHYAAASWGCSIFLHTDPMAGTHGTCGVRWVGLRPAQSPPARARRVSVGVICAGWGSGGAPPKTFCAATLATGRAFRFYCIFQLLSSRGVQRLYPRLSPTPDRGDIIQSVRAAFLGQLARWLPQAPPPPPVPPLSLAVLPPMTCVTVWWAQCNAPAERAGWSSLQAAWAAHPFQSADAHAAPLTRPSCAANMPVGSPVNDLSGRRGALVGCTHDRGSSVLGGCIGGSQTRQQQC